MCRDYVRCFTRTLKVVSAKWRSVESSVAISAGRRMKVSLQMKFGKMHSHKIIFFDKFCKTLSAVIQDCVDAVNLIRSLLMSVLIS